MGLERNEWSSTLEDFKRATNEDAVLTDILSSIIDDKFNRPINWVDVGSGDGRKIVMLRNKMGVVIKNLYCLEPDDFFVNRLEEIFKFNEVKANVLPYGLGTLMSDGNQDIDSFDLFTMIHVLYNDDSFESFQKLASLAKDTSAIIVVESPLSGFAQIRSRLQSKGIQTTYSKRDDIIKFLRNENIDFQVDSTSEQITRLDEEQIDSSQYWLYPFLLGINKNEFFKIGAKEIHRVKQVVKSFCVENDTFELATNDDIIIIN